ncbi:MAG: GumC family protein [Janthinobacterium lividum]
MSIASDSKKLLNIIRKRRGLALTVFVLVFGLGCLVSYLRPAKYTSAMRILIRATPTDLRATAQRADGGSVGQVSEEQVNSEVQLLTSYDLLKDTVIKNHLDPSSSDGGSIQGVDAATRKLAGDLNVSPVRKANIIEVQYSATSPLLAASVLRTIEGSYLDAHLRAQSTPGGFRFFQGEMQHYRSEFEQKQRAFADFSNRQGTANLDQQVTQLTKIISDQDVSLQQAQAQAAELATEIGKSNAVTNSLPSRIDTTRRSVPYQSVIDHLSTTLADLEARRIQQISKFRDDDPLVKETNSEIEKVKSELHDAGSLVSNEATTDTNPITQNIQSGVATRTVQLAGLQARISVLKSQILANRSAVNHLTDVSGQYRLLVSDVDNAKDSYNNYVQREENARISEGLDKNKISNVVVTQEPTESVLPVSSHRNLILGFSFLAAVFLSVAVCVLVEIFRPAYLLQPA